MMSSLLVLVKNNFWLLAASAGSASPNAAGKEGEGDAASSAAEGGAVAVGAASARRMAEVGSGLGSGSGEGLWALAGESLESATETAALGSTTVSVEEGDAEGATVATGSPPEAADGPRAAPVAGEESPKLVVLVRISPRSSRSASV